MTKQSKNSEIVEPDFAEAVYSNVKSSKRLLYIYNALFAIAGKAATKAMRDLLDEALPLKKDLEDVDGQVRCKVETKLSNELMDKMKKTYGGFAGAVALAKASESDEDVAAAKTLERELVNITVVFKTKGTFIAELKKALAKIKALPEDMLKSLMVLSLVARLDVMVADYDANYASDVEKTVAKNGTVKAAVAALREHYKRLLREFGYQQFNCKGAENVFTKEFNQICTRYSAAQKQSQTAKAKADAALAEKKKAEEEANAKENKK